MHDHDSHDEVLGSITQEDDVVIHITGKAIGNWHFAICLPCRWMCHAGWGLVDHRMLALAGYPWRQADVRHGMRPNMFLGVYYVFDTTSTTSL